jgi:hypothetical protein
MQTLQFLFPRAGKKKENAGTTSHVLTANLRGDRVRHAVTPWFRNAIFGRKCRSTEIASFVFLFGAETIR